MGFLGSWLGIEGISNARVVQSLLYVSVVAMRKRLGKNWGMRLFDNELACSLYLLIADCIKETQESPQIASKSSGVALLST
jgi:hypothetical protein